MSGEPVWDELLKIRLALERIANACEAGACRGRTSTETEGVRREMTQDEVEVRLDAIDNTLDRVIGLLGSCATGRDELLKISKALLERIKILEGASAEIRHED